MTFQAFADPNKPTEFDLGCILVDTAAEAGVKHVVYSSSPSSTELTEGKVKIEPMDSQYSIPCSAWRRRKC